MSEFRKDKYKKVMVLIKEFLNKPFNELPKGLSESVERIYFDSWDTLSSEQRLEVANQWFTQHDPAIEPVQRYLFDFYARLEEVEGDIRRWELVSCPTPRDMKKQENKLTELKKKHEEIEIELSQALRNEQPRKPVSPLKLEGGDRLTEKLYEYFQTVGLENFKAKGFKEWLTKTYSDFDVSHNSISFQQLNGQFAEVKSRSLLARISRIRKRAGS